MKLILLLARRLIFENIKSHHFLDKFHKVANTKTENEQVQLGQGIMSQVKFTVSFGQLHK